MTLTLHPKDNETKNHGPIVYFSSWEWREGNVYNYDTNSAYNTGGLFKTMGLKDELNKWLYKKSKEFIHEKIEKKTRQAINKTLNEGIKDKMIELIDDSGVVTAARFVGGYKELKEIVGDDEISRGVKVQIIMKYIRDNDDGVSLFEFGGPIPYREDDSEYHQIEYLGPSRAIINVYTGYNNETDAGEYGVSYEGLPDKSLEDIFEIIMEEII